MCMQPLSFERAWQAVENVRKRLLYSTSALDRTGIPYAVIGGNAVGAWVATVDEDAIRNTTDVDILINREDLARTAAAFGDIGFDPQETPSGVVFVERESPSPSVRRGLHIFYANERVRPGDAYPTANTNDSIRLMDGFRAVSFTPMLTMMLTSNRLKDRVQLGDLLELNMITPELDAALPPELRARLDELRANPE